MNWFYSSSANEALKKQTNDRTIWKEKKTKGKKKRIIGSGGA